MRVRTVRLISLGLASLLVLACVRFAVFVQEHSGAAAEEARALAAWLGARPAPEVR